ncbi:MAG TPA: methyltransferase domain-containing protein [Gemmatimonadaceae bacterium]|nr:methyltransferase domain-containing protein [Gemmatimonadaceae bacterium]
MTRRDELADARAQEAMADVRDFYNRTVEHEWNRLDRPLQRVEYLSTLRLVEAHFATSGTVCDIGCGPGRYAIELARRGYRVSLVDVARRSLDRAQAEFLKAGCAADRVIEASATDLSMLSDETFDCALLLGPLYHLPGSDERRQALLELRRILKPGGVAIVSYLNTWGIIRTGISDLSSWYRSLDTLRSLLRERALTSSELSDFTAAYWTTPPNALREVEGCDFEVVTYAGVEGFCGGMWPLLQSLAERDPEAYENVVTVAAETSELPQYRDATDHLHLVVRRPLAR